MMALRNFFDFESSFAIAHLNIRGLTSKIDEVKYLLYKHKFKIFCLSETFLNDRYSDSFYEIPDYNIVRSDRIHKGGGGLLCYIHASINFKLINPTYHFNEDHLLIKVIPQVSRPFLVSFDYRRPSSHADWADKFTDFVNECYAICEEIVFLVISMSTC